MHKNQDQSKQAKVNFMLSPQTLQEQQQQQTKLSEDDEATLIAAKGPAGKKQRKKKNKKGGNQNDQANVKEWWEEIRIVNQRLWRCFIMWVKFVFCIHGRSIV